MKKLPGRLEEFRRLRDVGKVLIIRDADGKCPSYLKVKMTTSIASRQPYPFALDFHVVCQELETWFLADHSALSIFTGTRVKRRDNPEGIQNAKEELERILLPRIYTPPVAETLAREIDLQIVEATCRSFRRFKKILRNQRFT